MDYYEEKLTSACASAFRIGYKDGFNAGYAAGVGAEPMPLPELPPDAGCKGCGGPVEDGLTVCDECCESVMPPNESVHSKVAREMFNSANWPDLMGPVCTSLPSLDAPEPLTPLAAGIEAIKAKYGTVPNPVGFCIRHVRSDEETND